MRFNKAIAAALALSMASTPVLAQSAAPLSVVSSVSRSGASTGDANHMTDSNYLLPGLLILAAITAAILLSNRQNSSLPTSA